MFIDVFLFTASVWGVAKPYAIYFLVYEYSMGCECDPPWVSSPLPLSHFYFARFLCFVLLSISASLFLFSSVALLPASLLLLWRVHFQLACLFSPNQFWSFIFVYLSMKTFLVFLFLWIFLCQIGFKSKHPNSHQSENERDNEYLIILGFSTPIQFFKSYIRPKK